MKAFPVQTLHMNQRILKGEGPGGEEIIARSFRLFETEVRN